MIRCVARPFRLETLIDLFRYLTYGSFVAVRFCRHTRDMGLKHQLGRSRRVPSFIVPYVHSSLLPSTLAEDPRFCSCFVVLLFDFAD